MVCYRICVFRSIVLVDIKKTMARNSDSVLKTILLSVLTDLTRIDMQINDSFSSFDKITELEQDRESYSRGAVIWRDYLVKVS